MIPRDTVRLMCNFNPRSPYGERLLQISNISRYKHFNPRSPYGERLRYRTTAVVPADFNPRSPYGERRCETGPYAEIDCISIHAPLTGSDRAICGQLIHSIDFNPRSPYGERLKCSASPWSSSNFNPRSPYGERRNYSVNDGVVSHFNPRSPYGERHGKRQCSFIAGRFQSTLPLRGATIHMVSTALCIDISIHAPLTGSDSKTAQNFT